MEREFLGEDNASPLPQKKPGKKPSKNNNKIPIPSFSMDAYASSSDEDENDAFLMSFPVFQKKETATISMTPAMKPTPPTPTIKESSPIQQSCIEQDTTVEEEDHDAGFVDFDSDPPVEQPTAQPAQVQAAEDSADNNSKDDTIVEAPIPTHDQPEENEKSIEQQSSQQANASQESNGALDSSSSSDQRTNQAEASSSLKASTEEATFQDPASKSTNDTAANDSIFKVPVNDEPALLRAIDALFLSEVQDLFLSRKKFREDLQQRLQRILTKKERKFLKARLTQLVNEPDDSLESGQQDDSVESGQQQDNNDNDKSNSKNSHPQKAPANEQATSNSVVGGTTVTNENGTAGSESKAMNPSTKEAPSKVPMKDCSGAEVSLSVESQTIAQPSKTTTATEPPAQAKTLQPDIASTQQKPKRKSGANNNKKNKTQSRGKGANASASTQKEAAKDTVITTTDDKDQEADNGAKASQVRKPAKAAPQKRKRKTANSNDNAKPAAPAKGRKRARTKKCTLCATCACQKGHDPETNATLGVETFARSNQAIERALIRRLQRLEKSVESMEEHRCLVSRKLKKHQRDMNAQEKKKKLEAMESKNVKASRFLPDAEILDAQETETRKLSKKSVLQAQDRVFADLTNDGESSNVSCTSNPLR